MYNQQGNVVFNITRGDTGELLFLIPGTIGQGE